MKLTDKIVEKYGADRVMHFLFGAWLVAEGKAYGLAGMLAMMVVLAVLVVLKETVFDDKFNKGDLAFSALGGMVSVILYIPIDVICNG